MFEFATNFENVFIKTLEKEYALRTHVYGRLVIELICINYFLLIIQGFWKNIYIIKNQT